MAQRVAVVVVLAEVAAARGAAVAVRGVDADRAGLVARAVVVVPAVRADVAATAVAGPAVGVMVAAGLRARIASRATWSRT